MKKYLSFFKIRFAAGLQYRAAAWAGVSTQFAWGFMTILMFKAFYESSPGAFPMEFSQLSGYIWLQQAFLGMFMAWFFDSDLIQSVESGSIAYELCRPTSLYAMWYTKNVAVRLSRTLLRCFPILIVAVFLPAPYGLPAPAGAVPFILFFVSMALGMGVLVSFSMLIYISMFYTVSSIGVRALAVSTVEFFSGALIPIPFFPEGMQKVINLLPFASTQSTPFLIYVGHIPVSDALPAVAMQAFWLVALTAAGIFWMDRSLRRVVVQGG